MRKAGKLDLLDRIVALSHQYGTATYVKGGGGNTSVKNAETLWVKPSGTTLGGLTRDWPRRGMVRPEALQKGIEGRFLDIVLYLEYFRKDDLLFPLELYRGEDRREGRLRDQFHGEPPIRGRHAGKYADAIAIGESIRVSACTLDRAPERIGVVTVCALEKHVLDEMNEAPRCGGFVSGPEWEPDGDGKTG